MVSLSSVHLVITWSLYVLLTPNLLIKKIQLFNYLWWQNLVIKSAQWKTMVISLEKVQMFTIGQKRCWYLWTCPETLSRDVYYGNNLMCKIRSRTHRQTRHTHRHFEILAQPEVENTSLTCPAISVLPQSFQPGSLVKICRADGLPYDVVFETRRLDRHF